MGQQSTYDDVRNTGLHSKMGLGRTHLPVHEMMSLVPGWNNPFQYDMNKALAEKI
jgi:hypothetical protein